MQVRKYSGDAEVILYLRLATSSKKIVSRSTKRETENFFWRARIYKRYLHSACIIEEI